MGILYSVVAILVSLALGGWMGFQHGLETQRGLDAIEKQHEVEAAEKLATQEAERRGVLALQNATRSAKAREIKLRAQVDALKNNRPECRQPDARVRLFNDAINSANGSPSDRVPDAMSPPAESGGLVRGGNHPVDP